jgi:N-acetylmuramic acid 6-phosphate etherase
VACTVNAPISQWADYALEIPTGAEILTGSTRLKAGTAQKMVLNMFSTGLMQQIGKVYSNLMIDMKASNSKLRERAIRIVAAAAGISTAEAAELMVASNREMKTAIVAARLGVSPEEARQRLAEVGGKVGRLLP